MQSCADALNRLCDRSAEVSAHYLISEAGTVFQMVQEDQRAWHAGAGQWGTVTDVNSRSIGIELANTGAHPFPEPQMQALETLLDEIMARHAIRKERIIGHSDMAPDRKSDPGARFDWRRLAYSGVSIWPNAHPPEHGFSALATQFGYAEHLPQDTVLRAFRDRFRPMASGPIDDVDRAMIADLAHRFPFDR